MELYIESSKTDQCRDGAWVVIACTCSELCPLGMFERYAKLAPLGQDQERFIFRGIVSTKSGEILRTSGGLSYTTRELVLEKLVEIGLEKSKIACVRVNAGILDCWFKRHGHWRNENAKDG